MVSRHVRQGRQQAIVRRLMDEIFFRIIHPGSRMFKIILTCLELIQTNRADAADQLQARQAKQKET
jgi:hypothetical protein